MTIPIVRNNMPQMPVSQEYFLYRVNALSAYSIDIQILRITIFEVCWEVMLLGVFYGNKIVFCFFSSDICSRQASGGMVSF